MFIIYHKTAFSLPSFQQFSQILRKKVRNGEVCEIIFINSAKKIAQREADAVQYRKKSDLFPFLKEECASW
jgi:hypothetical protein